MMMAWMRQSSVVACVAVVVFFTNLGAARLWDRDEPRNAGCAREMLIRGDWVTPVFNSELRSHKPVLLYWLMMTAYQMFGVSEFSARFWSAVAGLGTALATYAIGRRLFGGRPGMWAGIAVGSNLLFGMAGRAATPDAIVIFLSAMAIAVYVVGTFAPRGQEDSGPPLLRFPGQFFPTDWRYVVAMYALMGLATLAKGPVGIVLPTAVIGMFLLLVRLPEKPMQGRHWAARLLSCLRPFGLRHFLTTCWSMRPVTAITVAIAVAAPWYIWVGIRTEGEFLRGFFFEHNVGRAMQSMEGHNGGPLFYPASLLIGFFPWSVFAVPMIIDAVQRLRKGDPWGTGYLFATCWIGVYLGVFSVAQTKLPSYITPCFPGMALVAGAFFHHWTQNSLYGSILWRRLAMLAITGIGLTLTIALPLVSHQILPGEEWSGLVGLIPLMGGVIVWTLMERGRLATAAATFSLVAMLTVTAGFGVLAERVSQHQHNGQLLQAIQQHGDAARLASFGTLEPTWVFYGQQPIEEIHASGERTWLRNWIEVDRRWRPRPPIGLDDVARSDEDWLIITSDTHFARLTEQLPNGYRVLSRVPYFLKDETLLLVGRESMRFSENSTQSSHR